MSVFLLLLLVLLPLFNAERAQTELTSDDEFLMQRAVADNYLLNLPIRRYQLSNVPINRLPLLIPSDRDDQQRTKRIYWENLAFHADDYNQKVKKTKTGEIVPELVSFSDVITK